MMLVRGRGTMEMGLLFEGIVVGFVVAAPVGPIGVLCIRRTLAKGRVSGLVSGLGAASADAVYGLVVVLGLPFGPRSPTSREFGYFRIEYIPVDLLHK